MALALATSLLLGSFALLFIYYLLFSRSKRVQKPRQRTPIALGAIQALSSVFTPTSVAWPIPFTAHFERSNAMASRFQPRCMELDLSELVDHICAGKLELRDSRDLSYLLRGRLRVYGWNLKLYVDGRWWIKTAKWIASQHLFRVQITTQGLSTHSSLEPNIRVVSQPGPSFDLDFSPYDKLETEMRRIQERHQSENTPTIEFSCLNPRIRFMAPDFLLCAIPFLPGVYSKHQTTRKRRTDRTTTPLFVQLQDIVALLSATGSSRIRNIVDISSEHAEALYKLEQDLVDDRDLRTEHIKVAGVDGWREERFLMTWEAGLLRSGLLFRWRVTLNK
ncbi:hypothetical protein BDZ97DRAFT_1919245 [Flammula alnicola]|nr:hypothetical protein BDZ97DRAFT_1919245 [Flammula alnicola]